MLSGVVVIEFLVGSTQGVKETSLKEKNEGCEAVFSAPNVSNL